MTNTKNFTFDEFRCHCCGALPVDWREDEVPPILVAYQKYRDLIGLPVKIISGYRCPKHNAEVGGEPYSFHIPGLAGDSTVEGKTVEEMVAVAKKVPAFKKGGIGKYPTKHFVHLDVRGYMARWEG